MASTALTFAPAEPAAGAGVLITVIGAVKPRARIEIVDAATKLHMVSPEFSQDNALGVSTEAVELALGEGVTDGTFRLRAVVKNQVIGRVVGDVDLGYTDDLAYGAAASVISAACEYTWGDAAAQYEWGDGTVEATGGPLDEGNVALNFGGGFGKKKITVTADSEKLTGGTLGVTESVAGGADERNVAGSYAFGPLFLPAGTYSIDLKATAAIEGSVAIGDSLLSGPVALVVSA